MNRKILVTVLGLVVVLLATPYVGMAYAAPPTPVSGTQILNSFTPIGALPKGESDNVVVTALVDVTWAGNIAGHTVYEGKLMVHNFVPPQGFGPDSTLNIHERIFFQTVNVLGKTGSLTLNVDLGGSKGVFRWTILSGTDDLANLHGNGIYYGTGGNTYAYEGEVHFDP